MAVSLADLAKEIPGARVRGDGAVPITEVTADSRQAGPGVLFVAVRGTSGDGHRFVEAAVASGCAAVAVMDEGSLPTAAPCLLARDTRKVPALVARRLHDNPDTRLKTAAVTGTNGKTTVAFLLQALLGRCEGACGLLGTIHYDDGDVREAAPLTTPGGPTLYAWLGRMVANGCRAVALELSSHALDQERAAGLGLDAAVMTNLGRDHLDYHRDLEDYLRAKVRIVERLRPGGVLVVNAGDPAFTGLTAGDRGVLRFAVAPTREPVDLRVVEADLGLEGTSLRLDWRGRVLNLESPLVGRFNVENLVAALATGLALGYDPDVCIAALAAVDQVPGRVERFLLPAGALAVVDYAHTHDALAAVLDTCDELSTGRVVAVFGCGGDRDRGKRPLMGEVAARHADEVWVTSDNPRSEEPSAICDDIMAGYDGAISAPGARSRTRHVVVDRTEAIRGALASAAEGDVVVIAGKGHEDYQLVGDRVLHLDDRETVRTWLGEAGA